MATEWLSTEYDPDEDEAPEGHPAHDCGGSGDSDPPDITEAQIQDALAAIDSNDEAGE